MSAAPSNDYDTALQQCLARRAGAWVEDANIAFVLADDRPERHALQMLPVLEDAASQGEEVGARLSLIPLIAESSGPAAWRVKRSFFMYFSYFMVSVGEIAVTAAAAAAARGDSALPTLDWLLYYATDGDRLTIASAILDTRDEDALALLAPLLHEHQVRAALDRATETFPDWTFQRMLALLGNRRAEPALRARVMKVIEKYGAETTQAWASALGGRGEAWYDSLVAAGSQPVARDEDLPSFLRTPPWRAKKAASDDIIIRIEPRDSGLQFQPRPIADPPWWAKEWILGSPAALVAFIRDTEKELEGNQWARAPAPSAPLPESSASEQNVLTWLSRRFDELASSVPRHAWGRYSRLADVVHHQPESLALLLWDEPAAMQLAYGLDWLQVVEAMLSRFGARALPGLARQVEANPTALLPCVEEIDTPALAPVAARAFMKLKKMRAHGLAWLRAHPRAALLSLIPAAVGERGQARDAAEYAVRFYQAENPEVLAAVIAEYASIAPQLNDAIAQVLSRDPFARIPAKVARPPSWVAVSALSRPQLKTGGALSDAAMTATIEMLSFSNPADVYPGVAALREACTNDSIARFAWDLFSAWLAEGAPSRDSWAFHAVGWFGDDECARQLTRLVRKWPGESAHARAVTGLDVLADIGTDVALMNLNGIAEKVKFKGLQDRARDKIAAIAEARELSAEELADRLAPDLDLGTRGGLDLDFGPRIFRAGFDEFLKPWVRDESGARLKDLPKPVKSDDAEKSKEASAKRSALKKDARAIASLQLARLETMLATGSRLQPGVFETFFASHPLIRHLARHLVWGVYDTDAIDAAPTLNFRVGEDLSFTDADDNPVSVNVGSDAPGFIGLAHPLHMTSDDQARWGALFGDYEIAQPFPQLGREIHALTEAEKAADALTRFDGREVESKRLRGMAARGWRTGQPQDAGAILWLERSVILSNGDKVAAMLNFEEGLYAGAASEEPQKQKLGDITLDGSSHDRRQGARRFGELDAVTASEILRSVTLLVESEGA